MVRSLTSTADLRNSGARARGWPSSRDDAAVSRLMSYQDFLAWCDEDTLAEWVDGHVVMMSPASRHHQRMVDFLLTVLTIFVERRKLGTIISAPFQMKTGPDLPGREPDLIFVANENLGRLKPNHIEGPADVAIEVVSPESRLRDRGEKLAEYEAGGVREYWLLDPEGRCADFYRLGVDGRYDRQKAAPAGAYPSEVIPGFRFKEEWLSLDPLPEAFDALRELGVL